MRLKNQKMNSTSKYKDTIYGHIGISVNSDSLEATKEVKPNEWYAEFTVARLTKANSFIVLDEIFYIAKKQPSGKACRIYHVYRVSDMRYVCPSVLDKEETVKMVKRKYIGMVA